MISQNNPSDKEKVYSQINVYDFSEKVMEEKKRVFCSACGRMVSVSFIVAGLCKDCFNND